jgi:F420-0:gamma-glutamyl ligase-like protein
MIKQHLKMNEIEEFRRITLELLKVQSDNFDILKITGVSIITFLVATLTASFKFIITLINKGHDKEKLTIKALSDISEAMKNSNTTQQVANELNKENNKLTQAILNKIEHPIISTLEKMETPSNG